MHCCSNERPGPHQQVSAFCCNTETNICSTTKHLCLLHSSRTHCRTGKSGNNPQTHSKAGVVDAGTLSQTVLRSHGGHVPWIALRLRRRVSLAIGLLRLRHRALQQRELVDSVVRRRRRPDQARGDSQSKYCADTISELGVGGVGGQEKRGGRSGGKRGDC